jgi:hypothetical protein
MQGARGCWGLDPSCAGFELLPSVGAVPELGVLLCVGAVPELGMLQACSAWPVVFSTGVSLGRPVKHCA